MRFGLQSAAEGGGAFGETEVACRCGGQWFAGGSSRRWPAVLAPDTDCEKHRPETAPAPIMERCPSRPSPNRFAGTVYSDVLRAVERA